MISRPAVVDDVWEELRDAYVEYCWNVSRRSMALSLETAVLLWRICRTVEARSVADFGSGFSSYVLRRYAADTDGVTVTSVDDDPVWLARTGQFLTDHSLDASGLVSWEDYQAAPGVHDVVLHDLAGGELRESSMPFVASTVRSGGVAVFDDAHHPQHRAAMAALEGFDWVDARGATQDQMGRFAVVGIAK